MTKSKAPATLDHLSLRAWMERLGVDEAWVAERAGVSPHTVVSWLRPPTSAAQRNIATPTQKLLLIEFEAELKRRAAR